MKNFTNFLELSVLIPCYNAEQTIDRLMNSIMVQKYPSEYLRIIVTNDGSTDNTLAKLKDWQGKFGAKVMTIIDQKNQGLAESRNILTAAVKTKWFTFIDSDDYYEKKAFINFSKSSDNESVDVIVSKTYRKKGGEKVSWWLTNWMTTSLKRYVGNNLFFTWNKVYNTTFFRGIGFRWVKGNDMLEDQAFFAALGPKIRRLGVCRHYTYNFVWSKNSMSSVIDFKKNESKFKQMLANLDSSLNIMLVGRTYKQLSKIERKVLTSVVYNFVMQIFLTYIIFPAYYGFPKKDQDELNRIFYNEKRQLVTETLTKYGVKIYPPFGWWRKFTYYVLRLRSRYNPNKFKCYIVKKDQE
ncbi:MAG: glycosyltransferase family 2 protein [Mycoplasmataceae bacterium]|nr:glycosyltransferase family 2 protein [Mycoplasmataceae bacterium]